jgi:hypothetical protein
LGLRPGLEGDIVVRLKRPKRLKRLAASAVFTAGAAVVALASVAGAPPALASGPAVNVTPNPSTPGARTIFSVICGSSATAATLAGATLGLAARIPMQPITHTGDFAVTVVLPATTSPGLYTPRISCSSGMSATATLNVGSVPAQAPQTGDGATATTTSTPLMLAGTGLLGLAAGLGGFLAYRRKLGRRH